MLITCPECGHQVSDKAPVCPNCGIEIANKPINPQSTNTIEQQPAYEEEQVIEATPVYEPQSVVEATPVYESQAVPPISRPASRNTQQKKDSRKTLLISFVIAAVLCAVMLYIYNDAKQQLGTNDVVNMDKLKTMEEDVDMSMVDPNYKKQEAESREQADNTEPTEYTDKAEDEEAIETSTSTTSATEPTTAEMDKATSAVRRFFQAINSRNKEALNNSVSSFLTNFNGKERATKQDVQQYMVDLYQADVKNINWYIGDISNISKREVGENRYEYDITLDAKNVTEREGGTSTRNYTVKATVESDGKIGAMNVARK